MTTQKQLGLNRLYEGEIANTLEAKQSRYEEDARHAKLFVASWVSRDGRRGLSAPGV